MVYPLHNRFVVRGSFGNSPETWTYGLHFPSAFSGIDDVVPEDWDQAAITNAVNVFHGGSSFATSTKVTGWRGYHIGPDGRTVGNNLRVVEYDVPVGGAGTTKYPPQVTLVMSLRADNRGPARNGRCYLPGLVLAVDADTFQIASALCGLMATNFKTFIDSLKAAMYPIGAIGEELVNVSKAGSGVMQNVTTYRCGRVYDTMRSRRRALEEDYVELSAN